ncbi:hypothetical protein G3N58_09735 [Paraburkholderia sp. Ac-20342]|uniref:hypothetical protein n=1 Tax=unclassified Paraburkholderia TaxID=2615204 RepID=UPI00141E38B7|nr:MULTISPECIES: hypothetical protein [unclassified Paraburkholderia]MBN3847107.1 hypothetical protein [Paraburkholderia sp. Ac-20342]NIF76722.1 hypothetical protein [Paraburkholderia sp. Cy-641]
MASQVGKVPHAETRTGMCTRRSPQRADDGVAVNGVKAGNSMGKREETGGMGRNGPRAAQKCVSSDQHDTVGYTRFVTSESPFLPCGCGFALDRRVARIVARGVPLSAKKACSKHLAKTFGKNVPSKERRPIAPVLQSKIS